MERAWQVLGVLGIVVLGWLLLATDTGPRLFGNQAQQQKIDQLEQQLSKQQERLDTLEQQQQGVRPVAPSNLGVSPGPPQLFDGSQDIRQSVEIRHRQEEAQRLQDLEDRTRNLERQQDSSRYPDLFVPSRP